MFPPQAWRVKNWILGAMFFAWGVARLLHAPEEVRWTVPVIGAALLQWTVAALFTTRSAASAEGDAVDLSVAAVSILAGAWLVALLPPQPSAWPAISVVLIAVGALCAVVSLLRLGRSFAIFPAQRSLVTGGPYRLLRHPTYAGELVVMFGVSMAIGSALAWVLLAFLAAGLVWRIDREERLLRADEDHRAFCKKVRYRLLPGVW